jgi:hypothetical protein
MDLTDRLKSGRAVSSRNQRKSLAPHQIDEIHESQQWPGPARLRTEMRARKAARPESELRTELNRQCTEQSKLAAQCRKRKYRGGPWLTGRDARKSNEE